MTSVDDLLAILAAPFDDALERGPATPLRYAVRLLEVLRVNTPHYRSQERKRPAREWLDELARGAEPGVQLFLGDQVIVAPDADQRLGALRQWLRAQAAGPLAVPPLLLTKAVARAIEAVGWAEAETAEAGAAAADSDPFDWESEEQPPTLWDQLRLYYGLWPGSGLVRTRALAPGDPVPVCASVFGSNGSSERGRWGTSPRNLPRWRNPDRLANVILAPESVTDVHLTLDLSLREELNILHGTCERIATVHPMHSIDDVRFSRKRRVGRFNNVRPKFRAASKVGTVDRYVGKVVGAIDTAVAHGSQLIVLPELTQTKQTTEAVVAHWQGMADRTSGSGDAGSVLLLAGTHHAGSDRSSQHNVATLVGFGDPITITKSVPFVLTEREPVPPSPGAPDQAATIDLVEWLRPEPHPTITVFCSPQMTMMVFVCVDFLADPLRDLARDLDVTLVLIPSMTAKSQVFSGLIAGHVAATQSTVVLANAFRSSDENSRGTIGHPAFRTPLLLDHRWDAKSHSHTGVALVQLPTDEHQGWKSSPQLGRA